MRTWLLAVALLLPGVARADLFTAQGIAHGSIAGGNLGAGLALQGAFADAACTDCTARDAQPFARTAGVLHGVSGGLELAKAGVYLGLDLRMRGDLRGEELAAGLWAEGLLSLGIAGTSFASAIVLNESVRAIRKSRDEGPLTGSLGHAVRFSVAMHLITGIAALFDGTQIPLAILIADGEREVPTEEARLRSPPPRLALTATPGGVLLSGRW